MVNPRCRTYQVLRVQARRAAAVRIAVNAVEQQIGALLDLRLPIHAGSRVIQVHSALQTLHIVLAKIVDRVVLSVIVSKPAHEIDKLGAAHLVADLILLQEGREIFKVHRVAQGNGKKGCK